MGFSLRPLTRLEAHLLRTLRRAVLERESTNVGVSELYLLFPDDELGLKLALRAPGGPLSYVKVLIYGARPVRYQVEFHSIDGGRRYRTLWDSCLGPLNFIPDKSGVRDARSHLFYEVTYPEAFLKKLGE